MTKVKMIWGKYKGQKGVVTKQQGKNLIVKLDAGFEIDASTDHVEEDDEFVGKTFEQVATDLTDGDYKPNTKAFEKIRSLPVREVITGDDEYIIYGDTITRRVDGIKIDSRIFCRVRKTGKTLKKKLGTEWTVTM